MMMMKNQPWHLAVGWKQVVKIIMVKIDHLLKSIDESCVSLHRHSQSGVDTGCEGDMDERHQDGDELQHGEVLWVGI